MAAWPISPGKIACGMDLRHTVIRNCTMSCWPLPSQTEHPNILQIYGFGVENGIAYIEMPCLSGGTLASRLESGPPPPPETVCEWVDDLASALDAAHARGIIHRDIKSVNVLFDQSGRIVLADFGLAKSMADSSGLTAAGTLMGTPMYLSPEQSRGESLTPASDQFSLGVLAYRMLTGKLPVGAERGARPRDDADRVARARRRRRLSVPRSRPAVDAVFDRVLAKKPEGRYESCGAFALALREALLPRRLSALVDTPTEIAAQPVFVRRRRWPPRRPGPRAAPGGRAHAGPRIPALGSRRSPPPLPRCELRRPRARRLGQGRGEAAVGGPLRVRSLPSPAPVPVASPTPEPTPEPAPVPVGVVEQTPTAVPLRGRDACAHGADGDPDSRTDADPDGRTVAHGPARPPAGGDPAGSDDGCPSDLLRRPDAPARGPGRAGRAGGPRPGRREHRLDSGRAWDRP